MYAWLHILTQKKGVLAISFQETLTAELPGALQIGLDLLTRHVNLALPVKNRALKQRGNTEVLVHRLPSIHALDGAPFPFPFSVATSSSS